NTFEKIYECDLAGQAVVVAKKSRPNRLYFLRTFPGDDELDELLHRLLFTEHENIASTTDSFATTEGLFIIGDFMPLTLGHIVACRHYPDKEQLNAIMTQVGSLTLALVDILNGLSYIETQGLQHASLDSSGILMDTNGYIKIVGSIMMELLQNYTKDDGIVGIDNMDRWPSDSPPVTFLSSTTSASLLKSLMKRKEYF
ncbi:uncharacterized protein N7473_012537, partial [Penicillium subrubescens]|uniref:uncharacterized protein n=1 Tax=Penicillium subrubescens TaxID=1316194 RepID=UPI00254527B3